MVCFTCNACGESMKKAQVEKHLGQKERCRASQSVSCLDCGKDFRANEYIAHTKCISEEQKYSGKDYKEKPNAGKREKLLEQWMSHVQMYLETQKVDKNLKRVLTMLLKCDNIPKKGKAFRNFMGSSLKIFDEELIESAWKVVEDAKKAVQQAANADGKAQPSSEPNAGKENKEKSDSLTSNGHAEDGRSSDNEKVSLEASDETPKKKHKKRRKSKTGDDSMEVDEKAPESADVASDGKTKSHKRKRSGAVETEETGKVQDDDVADVQEDAQHSSKKKKKSKNKDAEASEPANDSQYGEDTLQWDTSSLAIQNAVDKGSDCDHSAKSSKKKKKHGNENETPLQDAGVTVTESSGTTVENGDTPAKKPKFKWSKVMEAIVSQSAEKKMKLKKLRKKVLEEYKDFTSGDDMDAAAAKFEEKLSGSKLTVDGKTVCMRE